MKVQKGGLLKRVMASLKALGRGGKLGQLKPGTQILGLLLVLLVCLPQLCSLLTTFLHVAMITLLTDLLPPERGWVKALFGLRFRNPREGL